MRLVARLRHLPLRAKLTFGYSAVIALLLSAIGLFLYLQFKSGLDASLNNTLRARADTVSALLRQDGVKGLERRSELVVGGDLTAQVFSLGGTLLFSSSGLRPHPLLKSREVREATRTTTFIDRHERERLLVERNSTAETVLVVATSLHQRERALELLNGALLVGGGLTLLVAALAGYGLASAVVRPMEAMRLAASNISDTDPDARLPIPPAEDEVHRLGVTLNDMLARLEGSRERERAFVSDASHELRTPLTILKTEVEVALRTDNPPETLRAALQIVGEEADRLIYLAEDLLLIASSDSGRLDLDRSTVEARALLEGVERRFRLRARESGRSFVIDSPDDAVVRVDVSRIEQALSNLVDNAMRHGSRTIILQARVNGAFLELHVLDSGPGLTPSFLPHAFERFTRAQNGRTGPGSGLGLAIVGLIAAAHAGEAGIENRSAAGGADAWLRLPIN